MREELDFFTRQREIVRPRKGLEMYKLCSPFIICCRQAVSLYIHALGDNKGVHSRIHLLLQAAFIAPSFLH